MFALRRPQHDGSTPWEHHEILPVWGRGAESVFLAYKSSNISETQQDRTKVTFVTIMTLMRTNRKS